MSAVVDEARENAAWLRKIAEAGDWREEDTERFERIASQMEQFSNAMFHPSLQLEKQTEDYLGNTIKREIVPDRPGTAGPHGDILAALWLIQRRLANLNTSRSIAGLGTGALAAVLGGAFGEKNGSQDDPQT